MNAIGVIPARYASTRFPAKVLASINGKPMIQHVWERARRSAQLQHLYIACDDEKVLMTARQFGAQAVMTDPQHPSGSDRIAEVVGNMDADIVVNIQADEPLLEPQVIDDLVLALKQNLDAVVATPMKIILDSIELADSNVVKVVVDSHYYALYFSRLPIPYNRNVQLPLATTYYKHLGLYAYRKKFLMQYKDWPKSMLEKTEQLEQLRILEAGYKIKTVVTDLETIAVDTPEDLAKVEAFLNKQGQRG